MRKQSSIQWFFDELKRLNVTVPSESAIELLESYKKTKEMHKQEIVEFATEYDEYCHNSFVQNRHQSIKSAEEIYNETFKSE